MKKLTIILLLLFTANSVIAQTPTSKNLLTPEEFREAISQEDVILIDVRTPEEFSEGHIKGSKNIDFLAPGFSSRFKDFNKEQPVYIYCRSGNRSGKAAKVLSEMGFKTIYDLKGGFLAWKETIKE